MTGKVVIPAKAGIYLALNHFLSLRENWIPAFAGMTKAVFVLQGRHFVVLCTVPVG